MYSIHDDGKKYDGIESWTNAKNKNKNKQANQPATRQNSSSVVRFHGLH